MSNSIQGLLNSIIESMLPKINSVIQGVVKSNHLDPWGQVAHGTDNLGSIDLGPCNASAIANYNIKNMIGLSSLNIDQLEITSVQQGATPRELVGTMNMTASLKSNLNAQVGGSLEAKCGLEHPSIRIYGIAGISGLRATAIGTFNASTDENRVCINTITFSTVSINYSTQVSLNELGIFNVFSTPLNEMIAELFKGQIRGAISSAITPIINEEFKNLTPQCQSL